MSEVFVPFTPYLFFGQHTHAHAHKNEEVNQEDHSFHCFNCKNSVYNDILYYVIHNNTQIEKPVLQNDFYKYIIVLQKNLEPVCILYYVLQNKLPHIFLTVDAVETKETVVYSESQSAYNSPTPLASLRPLSVNEYRVSILGDTLESIFTSPADSKPSIVALNRPCDEMLAFMSSEMLESSRSDRNASIFNTSPLETMDRGVSHISFAICHKHDAEGYINFQCHVSFVIFKIEYVLNTDTRITFYNLQIENVMGDNMVRSQKWGEDTAIVSVRVPASLNELIRDIKLKHPGVFNQLACNLLGSALTESKDHLEDNKMLLIELAVRNPHWTSNNGQYFRAWAEGPAGRETLQKCNLTVSEAWELIQNQGGL